MQQDPIQLYLDLMKKCLSFFIWGEIPHPVDVSHLTPQQQSAWLALRESLGACVLFDGATFPSTPRGAKKAWIIRSWRTR